MEASIAAREEAEVAVATFFNASVNLSGFEEDSDIFIKSTPAKDSLQLSGEEINLNNRIPSMTEYRREYPRHLQS